MKKFFSIAVLAALVLSGCAKPITEVKAGASPLPTQNLSARILIDSSMTAQTSQSALQSDIRQIEQLGMQQHATAQNLQQRLEIAMQNQDQQTLKQLFGEFRSLVEQNNQQLMRLNLHTPEAKTLREKMIDNSNISLQMSAEILKGDIEHPDMTALAPLKQQSMQAQQELMAISQDIAHKLQPAATSALSTAP